MRIWTLQMYLGVFRTRKAGKNGAGKCRFGGAGGSPGPGTLTWHTEQQELRRSHPAGMPSRERGRDAAGGVWMWSRRNSRGRRHSATPPPRCPRELAPKNPPSQKSRNFPIKSSRPFPGDLQGPSPGISRGQSRDEKRRDGGSLSGSFPGVRITPGTWDHSRAVGGEGCTPRSGILGRLSRRFQSLGKEIFFRRMLHLLGCPVNLKERGDLRRKSRILRRMLWGLVASRRFPSLQFPVGRGAKAQECRPPFPHLLPAPGGKSGVKREILPQNSSEIQGKEPFEISSLWRGNINLP